MVISSAHECKKPLIPELAGTKGLEGARGATLIPRQDAEYLRRHSPPLADDAALPLTVEESVEAYPRQSEIGPQLRVVFRQARGPVSQQHRLSMPRGSAYCSPSQPLLGQLFDEV